jgi:hypothetical protein
MIEENQKLYQLKKYWESRPKDNHDTQLPLTQREQSSHK